MTKYTHLNLDEREKLYIMRKQGLSFADIGKKLARNPSTLSREYKRNQVLRHDREHTYER